ncbi:hypothetical protein J2S71_000832 [Olsenella profusa DSM 13989]|uniref:Type VII secretion effector, TIGR04197 family n=1 Tax=Olsenella profusa F0195 TaxID=1125712 RepID=U2V3K7_9ACTN|nr:hypothetical protein [Olsenella profusa]ERL09937.1 hypothetical protein HMPREF1316_2535 [Olsenella profusa F0195]MDP9859136.1 hypothetical protein [Olsenella profusa DSM 13989]
MADGTIAQNGQAQQHAQAMKSSWSAPTVDSVGDDNTQAEAGVTSTAQQVFSIAGKAFEGLSADADNLEAAGNAISQADQNSAENF